VVVKFQLLLSELYKKDIPLTLLDTHEWYPPERGFTGERLSKFDEEARDLNEIIRAMLQGFIYIRNDWVVHILNSPLKKLRAVKLLSNYILWLPTTSGGTIYLPC
jgi:hypothetical protein